MPSLMSGDENKNSNRFVVSQEFSVPTDRFGEATNNSCINYGRIPNQNYDAAESNTFSQSLATTTYVPAATSALEQYRLQLYNYALHMERLKYGSQDHSLHNHRRHHYNAEAHSSPSDFSTPSPHATSTSRLALSMSLFPQHMFKAEDPKPQHSYIGLIAMAILSSAELKLVLSDIYQYILDNYPYFRTRGPGWRNSIRHNLSLNDCFVKSGRSANGKGHYWAIHPANMDDFRKGDFRRRKAQRKVRKHMGLTVDDTGTDSPSPPPLDLSSPPPPVAGTSFAPSGHTFTVTQQIAAFNYLNQRQNPIAIVTPQINSPYINFRPLSARYYITSPLPLNCVPQKHDSHNVLSSKTKCLSSTASTASMIESFYTQSKKKPFDMASLLAPEVTTTIAHEAEIGETTTTTTTMLDVDVDEELRERNRSPRMGERPNGVRTTQLQHTVITKVTMNQCNHHVAVEEEFIDDQNEDIDVVDVANDFDLNDFKENRDTIENTLLRTAMSTKNCPAPSHSSVAASAATSGPVSSLERRQQSE